MDTLRARIPFKFSDDQPRISEDIILDEQGLPTAHALLNSLDVDGQLEQEEIVQSLRVVNTASSRQYLIFLRVILSLSFFLQLMSLLHSSRDNPLLAVIPPTVPDPTPSILLPAIFTVLSLLLHINIYFLAFPDDLKTSLRLQVADVDLRPLSYPLCYALAAIAPTLSVFLRQAWQSNVWWGLTMAVICVVQTVTEAVAHGNESISRLETMKYVAHGA